MASFVSCSFPVLAAEKALCLLQCIVISTVHVILSPICRCPEDTPRQTNGCDCGVFTILFAEHLARNLAMDFGQSNIPNHRRSLAAHLMQVILHDSGIITISME